MKKRYLIIALSITFLLVSNIVSGINVNLNKGRLKQGSTGNLFEYDQKFAVIIVGTYGSENQEKISGHPREQYYEWYTGSAQTRFDLLTNERYNFNPENIFVLLTEIKDEGYAPHSSFDSSKFINYYNATKENISMVFDILSSKIDDNDLLVVDLIGHGGDDGLIRIPIVNKILGDRNSGIGAHDTFMGLEPKKSKTKSRFLFRIFNCFSHSSNVSSSKYRLYDYELADYVADLSPYRTIFVLQPCFSGGFINDLSSKKHIILSASKEDEMAGNFLGPLNRGMSGTADDNEDGLVSLSEIFQYTINNMDPEEQGMFHPLIDDNGDGVGSENLNNDDGVLASSIYDLSFEQA